MDFDAGHRGGSNETQDSKINVYNVVLSYVIEMNEFRSELYTVFQMTGITPASFKDFIRTFYKLFTFTQSMLPQDLRKEIENYFAQDPRKMDTNGKVGIRLSQKMQKELENQRMITLYEETIVPPFVEPEEEVPTQIKKGIQPVKRTVIEPSAGAVKSLFRSKK